MRERKRSRRERTEWAAVLLTAFLCGMGIFLFQSRYVTGHVWQAVAWGGTAFTLSLLAYIDYRERRLPNGMILGLLLFLLFCLIGDAVGLGSHIGTAFRPWQLTAHAFPDRLLGALCPILLFGIVNLIRPLSIGAGDGKLFLVLGFFFGFEAGLRVLFLTFLFAAVAALAIIHRKKADRFSQIPLGPALWAAFLVTGCLLS